MLLLLLTLLWMMLLVVLCEAAGATDALMAVGTRLSLLVLWLDVCGGVAVSCIGRVRGLRGTA